MNFYGKNPLWEYPLCKQTSKQHPERVEERERERERENVCVCVGGLKEICDSPLRFVD